ncbi:hypothetical protein [Kribbella sp. NPDC003557]|uniref:hypothetical protein n=1 Tax=Kribbella sp. NPDC003557 TaxID=3154449 RepID=UPI0033AB7271
MDDQDSPSAVMTRLEKAFRKAGLPSFSHGIDRRYGRRVLMVTVSIASVLYLAYWATILIPQTPYRPGAAASIMISVVIVLLFLIGWQERRGPGSPGRRLLVARHPRWVIGLGVLIGLATGGVIWAFGDREDAIRLGLLNALWSILSEAVMVSLGAAAVILLHVLRSLRSGFPSGAGRSFVVMPTVLAVLLIIFVTEDAWRLFGDVSGRALATTVGLLATLSLYLQYSRLRPFCSRMGKKASLTRLQRLNVAALLLMTVLIRLLLLGLFTAAALIVFGIILVDERHARTLLGGDSIHVVRHLHSFGAGSVLTRELLNLAALLGAFAGLAFSAEPRSTTNRDDSAVSELISQKELAAINSLVESYTNYHTLALAAKVSASQSAGSK